MFPPIRIVRNIDTFFFLQKPEPQDSYRFNCSLGIDVVVMPATPRDSPVLGAKPVIAKKPEDLEKIIGESAEFELIVEDETDVSVSWFKDKTLLLSTGRYKIWQDGKSFFLKIRDLEVEDEALYECKVRNECGEIMCDVQLLVDGMVLSFTKK